MPELNHRAFPVLLRSEEMVADILKKKYDLKEKEDFLSTRKGITDVSKFSLEERNAWIRQNPAYGTIVCRCEMVTEGEIIDAIRGPLGARSLDGVKRRTRAGMGRCQAGFCSPRVMGDFSQRTWNSRGRDHKNPEATLES